MRVLIFGTMYLSNEKDCKLINAWYECWKRYNSEHDYLLIDSNSDDNLIQKLNIRAERNIFQYDDIFYVSINQHENLISFKDNIGHLELTGHDGWGRAFCTGIANAIGNNYDYAVHIESDLLFRGNVSNIVKEMEEISYKVFSTKSWLYGFLETGLMFMNVPFLKDINFISQYNWRSLVINDHPELIIPKIIGSQNIALKYWIGDRNDYGQIPDETIEQCIYLTHCSETQVRLFMEQF